MFGDSRPPPLVQSSPWGCSSTSPLLCPAAVSPAIVITPALDTSTAHSPANPPESELSASVPLQCTSSGSTTATPTPVSLEQIASSSPAQDQPCRTPAAVESSSITLALQRIAHLEQQLARLMLTIESLDIAVLATCPRKPSLGRPAVVSATDCAPQTRPTDCASTLPRKRHRQSSHRHAASRPRHHSTAERHRPREHPPGRLRRAMRHLFV